METDYTGMTVNERLFVSGLMNDFDNAVKRKNKREVILILKKIDLTEESILPILKTLGLSDD